MQISYYFIYDAQTKGLLCFSLLLRSQLCRNWDCRSLAWELDCCCSRRYTIGSILLRNECWFIANTWHGWQGPTAVYFGSSKCLWCPHCKLLSDLHIVDPSFSDTPLDNLYNLLPIKYGLLLSVVVILSLLPLPFGIIVELSNFAFCLSVALEFLAFAQLRIRKGGMPAIIIYCCMC